MKTMLLFPEIRLGRKRLVAEIGWFGGEPFALFDLRVFAADDHGNFSLVRLQLLGWLGLEIAVLR